MSKRATAVEQTRRRIVDATRALHGEQGIRATSWDDIARRAGVGVGTVYRHFPSLDELIPACGEVSLRIVALPDPDEVAALFEGAAGPAARVRRLVSEAFAIWERGAADLQPIFREPDVHPAVRRAGRALEAALAALVAAALEPLEAGATDRQVARAMIDIGVWRALRGSGLDAAEAVDAASELLASRFA